VVKHYSILVKSSGRFVGRTYSRNGKLLHDYLFRGKNRGIYRLRWAYSTTEFSL
jgi:hypothetical protein